MLYKESGNCICGSFNRVGQHRTWVKNCGTPRVTHYFVGCATPMVLPQSHHSCILSSFHVRRWNQFWEMSSQDTMITVQLWENSIYVRLFGNSSTTGKPWWTPTMAFERSSSCIPINKISRNWSAAPAPAKLKCDVSVTLDKVEINKSYRAVRVKSLGFRDFPLEDDKNDRCDYHCDWALLTLCPCMCSSMAGQCMWYIQCTNSYVRVLITVREMWPCQIVRRR